MERCVGARHGRASEATQRAAGRQQRVQHGQATGCNGVHQHLRVSRRPVLRGLSNTIRGFANSSPEQARPCLKNCVGNRNIDVVCSGNCLDCFGNIKGRVVLFTTFRARELRFSSSHSRGQPRKLVAAKMFEVINLFYLTSSRALTCEVSCCHFPPSCLVRLIHHACVVH